MKLRSIAVVVGVMTAMTTGCAPALIVDLEDDKVIVQAGSSIKDSEVLAKAREGCSIHGRRPVPVGSMQCLDQYCLTARHLFACKQ